MVTDTELFEKLDLTPLDFCLWDRLNSQVYKSLQKTGKNTREELFGRVLDAAARIKKREDQLRRTIRDLRTRTAHVVF
jgi:uncharacterized protein (UPF0297 family)